MHTKLHNDHLAFTTAQQYLGFAAGAMQCTRNGLELNTMLCMILNYLLEDGLELHEMHHAHMPELCCQMLTKYDGHWL